MRSRVGSARTRRAVASASASSASRGAGEQRRAVKRRSWRASSPLWILTAIYDTARSRHRSPSIREGEPRPVTTEKPEVLFVCVHNAGRSQMAAGLVKLRSEGRVHVRSAGSDPGDEINPAVVEAMDELGVDMSEEFPKPLTDEVVRAADVGDHDGLRRCVPDLPRQALRGLGARRPGRAGPRHRAPDPGRDRRPRAELVDELLA